MDIFAYNRQAWDRQVDKGNRWTVPVGPEAFRVLRPGGVLLSANDLMWEFFEKHPMK